MHTGYDNFWMYQNNRHEPVLNLPKNDNCSQAILTDSYKQVQNGGHPSQMNSYISPQNNVASSHQNVQHRTPDSDCLWPTSACSMPLKFPYLRNAHPQEAFLTQSNNVYYLSSNSQPQQNYNFTCLKNSNVNVSHQCKGNNNTNNYYNCGTPAFPNKNQRIRVKDIFTLSSPCHPHSKKQECALNYPTVNYTMACTSETQSEIINYRKNNIPQPLHTCYGHTAGTEKPPQYLQNTNSFYEQNAEYLLESQFQFRGRRPIKQNFHLEVSKTNTSILGQLLNLENGQESKDQIERSHSESMYENTRISVIPERHSVPISNFDVTNNSEFGSPLEVNTGLNHETSILNNITQIQLQENFTRINEACLSGSISSGVTNSNGVKSVTSNRNSPSYEQISEPEDGIIKISFPQICQNISPSQSDCNNTDKNSNLSSPISLESNDVFFNTLKNNNGPINSSSANENKTSNLSVPHTSRGNFNNNQAPPSTRTSPILIQNFHSPPRKTLCSKELLIDVNRESITNFLNSNQTNEDTTKNLSAMNDSGAEIISTAAMARECPLNVQCLKQENYNASTESPSPAGHFSEGKVLFEIIKTEEHFVDENSEDLEEEMEVYESESSEKSDALTEPFEFDDRENIYFTEIDVDEKPPSSSEEPSTTSSEMKSVKNYPRTDTPNYTNSVAEEKIEKDEADMTEVGDPKRNFKSKINRDKLDMLIKFLEKDESLEAKLEPPCTKKFDSDKDGKKDVDLNHNRRKLRKTSVVKNKNNSREMVSYKTARVELTKCSSLPSQIVKSSTRSGKYNAEDGFKNMFLTEQLQEVPTKHSSEPNCKIQDEQNFISTMRALQTLQVHFCMSCGLISPIESFWINVASGELRCFNCFSKMTIRNGLNAFRRNPDSPISFGLNPIQKGQAEKGDVLNGFEQFRQNNLKDGSVGLYKVERGDSVNARETSRQEIMSEERQTRGENTKREATESSQRFRQHSGSSDSRVKKGRISDDQKITAEQLVRINKSNEVSPIHKAENSECTSKVEKKDKKGGDSSNQHKKRRDSKDSKLLEEHSKKEGKRDSSDKYEKKAKESHMFHKGDSEEQLLIKKNAKQELPEKTKIQSPSKENKTEQKPKLAEQAKPKNLNSSDESKGKSTFSFEKHKKTNRMHLRKRKNSDEVVGLKKIRIVEDSLRKEQIPTKITNVLKEDSTGPKNKVVDNEKQKNSAEKSRHNSFSKERDQPKKETKASGNSKIKDFLKGDEAHQKIKTNGISKQQTSDLINIRRTSKDDPIVSRDTSIDKHRRGITPKEDPKSPTSTLLELSKKDANIGGFATENNDRKKTEEKEKKFSSGKTQKTSGSEKDNREKVVASTENTGRPRKSDATSKPLKESQNSKVSTQSEKLKNKEPNEERKDAKKQKAEGRKDEKKVDKNIKEKLGKNSEKKKDNERLEEKCDKTQTQSKVESDKLVESAFGGKNEVDLYSLEGKLLEKLIKKAKKLSWDLLSDA